MELVSLGRAQLVDKARNLWREAFAFETKEVEGEDRTIRFVASTEDVDRDGDVISVDGWDLRAYKKNPVVLWAHQSGSPFNPPPPPIGTATRVQKADGKLLIDVRFAKAEDYPFADTIYRLTKDKIIRAGSVGFIPKSREDRKDENGEPLARGTHFRKQELLEFSPVPVPSNPNALVDAQKRGVISESEVKEFGTWLKELRPEEDGDEPRGMKRDITFNIKWNCETGEVIPMETPLSKLDFEDYAARLQREQAKRFDKIETVQEEMKRAFMLLDDSFRELAVELREGFEPIPDEDQKQTASEDPSEVQAALAALDELDAKVDRVRDALKIPR